jgi:hypothetical protein
MRQAQRALTKLQPRRPRVHPDQDPDDEIGMHQPQQHQTTQQPQVRTDDRPEFDTLAESRWPQDELQTTLIGSSNINQNGDPDNQTMTRQSHNHQVHSVQGLPPEQSPASHHHSRIDIVQQTFHRTAPSQAAGGFIEPKHHRQQQGGHPAAAQLVLTNFKIEFTCTTCGALNQSFFPNQGDVSGASYLARHSMANQNNTRSEPITAIHNDVNNTEFDDDDEYVENTTNHGRGMQSPWTQGGLEVSIAPTNG